MNKHTGIFIVGHNDSIENSLRWHFLSHGFRSVFTNTHDKINILNQQKVKNFLKREKPGYVFLGSIRSGGIAVNVKYPAEFIYENCQAQNNIIHAAYEAGVKKLIYFAGSCVYPKQCPQPMTENHLLTGPLEETSAPYSIAKIAGTAMCQAYRRQYGFNAIVAVPATLYGPGSDADIETAHVMGALIAKFHKAVVSNEKEVMVWGSGKPRREFLHVDDFVSACIFLLNNYDQEELINVGCGEDVTIKQLAYMIKEASGFKGKIIFDASKTDGTMRKLMDNRRILKLGWKPKVKLEEGIQKTVQWYRKVCI